MFKTHCFGGKSHSIQCGWYVAWFRLLGLIIFFEVAFVFCMGTCILKNHSTLLHALFLTKIKDCVRSDINIVLLFLVLCWISSISMFCNECMRLPSLWKKKYRGKCTTHSSAIFGLSRVQWWSLFIVIDTWKCSSFPCTIQFLFI